jgi:hypothetical protein
MIYYSYGLRSSFKTLQAKLQSCILKDRAQIISVAEFAIVEALTAGLKVVVPKNTPRFAFVVSGGYSVDTTPPNTEDNISEDTVNFLEGTNNNNNNKNLRTCISHAWARVAISLEQLHRQVVL